MDARIRVKTREGRDLNPGSIDVFARLIREGEISDADLIYDRLTGEWAPARAHPMYRMVADSLLPEGAPPSEDEGDDLGLSLAPAAPEPTPEEATAAFIAEMAAERAADPEVPTAMDDLGLVAGDAGGSSVVDVFGPRHEAPPPPRPRPVHQPRLLVSEPRSQGPWTLWMVSALLLVTVGVTAPTAWRLTQMPASDERPVRTVARAAPTLEDAARSDAMTVLVDEAHALLDQLEVGPVPPVWLEGEYLAGAARHADVRASWERYLAFVWALRASEERRFRDAYLAELDRDGVGGSMRTMRLTSALLAFREARSEREAVYERIEELSVAALSLHDLLVHLSGSIRFVPARGEAISVDPVIEAVGVDEEAQQLLDDALDRVTRAVEGGGAGPGTRERVLPWVAEQVEVALLGR